MTIRVAILFSCAVLALGCEPSVARPPRTSARLATKELGLVIEARSNGSVTQAFVELVDKQGIIPLGPMDKLSFAEVGGREIPFVPTSYHSIAQIATKGTTFSIIFTRGSERFVTTMEMPPPFSLVALDRYDEQDKQPVVDIRWTPSPVEAKMLLRCQGGYHQYSNEPIPEVGGLVGSLVIPQRKFSEPPSVNEPSMNGPSMYRPVREVDGIVVTATRRGGKVTLHPALADFALVGTLEQIRVVTAAPYLPPQAAAIAGDPAP